MAVKRSIQQILALFFLVSCSTKGCQAFLQISPCAHTKSISSHHNHDSRKQRPIHATPAKEQNPKPTKNQRNLHPPTISAISAAILIRSQNKPDMPLRFIENGKMEAWEITLSAGKIAQPAVETWRDSLPPEEDTETIKQEMEVMAGRIVATVSRLEELEGELLRRCESCPSQDWALVGVPSEEMKALNNKSDKFRIQNAMAAIDAACLFDDRLRYNRAKAVFALFLHELEGPGLKKNKVVLPCMEVDFLEKKEWEMLFGAAKDEKVEATNEPVVKIETNEKSKAPSDDSKRPSLHPIAISAIEESFRLRSQNSTTSPLRLIDSSTEWYEVEYSAMKFADRFLQQHSKTNRWTEEELQTIGGRIVGTLMRMDDLEWEWNHRVCTSSLGQVDSVTRIPDEEWKRRLGLFPSVEQRCIRTVDLALAEEKEFARKRAEIMYGLFLMIIEEPALKASGSSVPGGSNVREFIDDVRYLELMMPRIRK